MMYRFCACFALCCFVLCSGTCQADEPLTLIGTIVKWRYPDAEIGKSQMSDAATVDANGKRTVPSTLLKTTMVTNDPVEKVVDYYKSSLVRKDDKDSPLGQNKEEGVSVLFDDESTDRSLQCHTVLVNSANNTTVIVISRATGETQTYITWKQYVQHNR